METTVDLEAARFIRRRPYRSAENERAGAFFRGLMLKVTAEFGRQRGKPELQRFIRNALPNIYRHRNRGGRLSGFEEDEKMSRRP